MELRGKLTEAFMQAAGKRRTTVAAKAVIIDGASRVLLLRRSKTDKRRPLSWDLPGGLVAFGEDPLEAVKREVREETGLGPVGWRPVAVFSAYGTDTKQQGRNRTVYKVLLSFAGDVPEQSVPELSWEHDQYLWADAAGPEVESLPAHWRAAVTASMSGGSR